MIGNLPTDSQEKFLFLEYVKYKFDNFYGSENLKLLKYDLRPLTVRWDMGDKGRKFRNIYVPHLS